MMKNLLLLLLFTSMSFLAIGQSNFCSTAVTHFGGNPPNSEILLTVVNISPTMVEITAESNTASPIDFLQAEGAFPTASSTTVVGGQITITVTVDPAPANFEFQLLWSLEDFGGNWQLIEPGMPLASTPFDGTCPTTSPSNFCSTVASHFGGNPPNSEILLTVENISPTMVEITAESNTASPIDFLQAEGAFPTASSTTVVGGQITITVTIDPAPANFEFQLLWSLEDFGGNWQLIEPGMPLASTPFDGTCPASPPPPMTGPTDGAPNPICNTGDVISMFSNSYTNVPVDTWLTPWSAAPVTITAVQIAGNDAWFYQDVAFLGIETVSNQIDASGMAYFNIDMWTDNATEFRIKLVDFGPNGIFQGGDDTEFELTFTPTQNGWNCYKIPLTDFAGMNFNNIAQLILSAMPGGQADFYIDNVYFSNDQCVVPAPEPTCDPASVISMYSNAYMDVPVDTWLTPWSAAPVSLTDINICGDDIRFYQDVTFLGIETVSNQLDVSNMVFFNIDFWTGNATQFRIKLVDFGPNGIFQGGDDTEFELTFDNPAQNQWISYEIPLSDFAGMNFNNIAQLILSAMPDGQADFYIDNVYFSSCANPVDVELCVDLSCDLNPPAGASVIGVFNQGDAAANMLSDPDGDGVWCATVSLLPGTHVYKFFNQAASPQREDLTGLPCTTTDPFFGAELFRFVEVVANTPMTVTTGWETCDPTCIPPLPPPDLPLTFDDQMMFQYNITNFGGMSSVLGVDPTDPSNAVVCATKTVGAECFAGTIVNDVVCLQNPVPFTADDMVMTMDVYSPAAGRGVLLKLEDCNNGGISTEVLAITTVANAWETLVFDFSMACPVPNLAESYSKIVVFPGWTCDPACGGPNGLGNTPGDGSVYYVDNIMMCALPFAGITCPADMALDCTDPIPAAATDEASFLTLGGMIDNPCGTPLTVSSSDDVVSTGGANSTLTRTYTISDGTTTFMCDQVITFSDAAGPTVTCPLSVVVDCESVPEVLTSVAEFLAAGGTATDDCAMSMDLSLAAAQVVAGDVCPTTAQQTITRTYTITDLNNNASSCNQTITIFNSTTGPIITSVPLNKTVDCAFNVMPELHLFTADADCNLGLTYTVSEVSLAAGTPNCPNAQYEYTYTVTDDCGRSESHVQSYTIQNEGPELICANNSICMIDCSVGSDMIEASFAAYANLATVSTSCSGSTTVTNNFNPNGFFNQNCNSGPVSIPNTVAWQNVTFTAIDQCGRTSTCTALVVIQDTSGPQIDGETFDAIRYDNALAQSAYETWANDNLSNLSVGDDCNGAGSVSWSYSPASPNTTFAGPFATTEVTFTATDACGNASSVTATFRLKEEPAANMFNITGAVFDEYNEEVENVAVSLSLGGQGQMNSYLTSNDGYFEFEGELDENYEVSPHRNDDPLNGVSTMDLILISKHILGIELLDSPYKLIAADANNSGTITGSDLVEIRKVILFITEAFDNSDSWRFVEEEYVFPDPTNPFAFSFPSIYSINGLTADQVANFIAVKIGDVNGSATPNQLAGGGDTRTQSNLSFQVEEQQLTAGQTYMVDFKAKDFNNIAGFQFSLNFDANQVGFVDLHTGALPEMSAANFSTNRLNEGVITSSWNLRNAMSIENDAVLFSLEFTAKADVQLSEVLQLSSRYTAAEAYNDAVETLDLDLEFKGELGSDTPQTFALYQNQPNPFADNTVISFNLPAASKATLTVFDMAGRVLLDQTGDFAAGFNQISIDQSNINHTGLMYYTLQTDQNKATKKMIILAN